MERKYFVLPVNDAKAQKRYYLRDGEQLVNDFTAAVDKNEPAFEAYIDVTRFGDAELTLTDENGVTPPYRVTTEPPKRRQLKNGMYLRPAAHYTTTLGWTNDPNGLIRVGDTYHMFYQHNPMSCGWGNMTWGHAVSRDLVNWDEVGDELFPDSLGVMFSGSAICDERNVAGFGEGAILLFYTAAGNGSDMSRDVLSSQCLAYSVDGGETFTKYEKNPIIPHIIGGNRDPKVEWSSELELYTLSLYLDGNTYAIFTSADLLSWERWCDITMPNDNECPDFYPLTLDGERYWVFVGAHDTYLIGQIRDGHFVPCQEALPYHIDPGASYAAQTFSGTGDRRIKIAWGRNAAPGAVFNSQMGLPCEMFLKKVGDVIRLGSRPVAEVSLIDCGSLCAAEWSGIGTVCFGRTPENDTEYAVDVTVEIGEDCGDFTLSCYGMELQVRPYSENGGYANGTYSHGGCVAPLSYTGTKKLRVIFDTLGIEVFADDGLIYSTMGAIADRSRPLTVSSASPYSAVSLKIVSAILRMKG